MCFRVTRPDNSNQQGPDRGSSYRSIAFIKMQQRRIIEDKIKELTANKVFANPIVTEVKPVTDFMKQRIIIKIM
jgi:peptide-methionine (S)-S-oxide reductase